MTHLVSTPGEHGKRDGDGHVDTNLSNVDISLELARSGSGLGEDGGSVTIPVLVDNLDGFVESVSLDHNKCWTEDLLTRTL